MIPPFGASGRRTCRHARGEEVDLDREGVTCIQRRKTTKPKENDLKKAQIYQKIVV